MSDPIDNPIPGPDGRMHWPACRLHYGSSECSCKSTVAPTDINEFRQKKPEWVFECSCGSQLFFLNHDGTVECRSCKCIRESIEWVYRGQKK